MCHVNRDSLTHCSQGSVAQLVEQRTSNPKVVGSNPTWATEFSIIQLVIVSVGYHHWCCPEDGSNIRWYLLLRFTHGKEAVKEFELLIELILVNNLNYSHHWSGMKISLDESLSEQQGSQRPLDLSVLNFLWKLASNKSAQTSCDNINSRADKKIF